MVVDHLFPESVCLDRTDILRGRGCGIIDRYKNKYAHDNPIEEAAEELISKSLSGGQKIDFTPDSPDPDSPEP